VNANWDLLVPNQSGGSRGAKEYSVNLRRRRDAEIFRALHDEHAHSLLLYVVGLTRERVIAQDIVQETPAPSVAQRGSARTDRWLRATLVVHGGQAHRQRPMALGGSRAEVLTGMVPEHAVPDTVQQTVDRQLVHAALRTLSIAHRRALFECYFRGASVAEAARTLGVPPGTVKYHLHHALRALRQEVDEARASATPTSN
jgi:RNA polymerase sigma-70 factor (ECF subfamily)